MLSIYKQTKHIKFLGFLGCFNVFTFKIKMTTFSAKTFSILVTPKKLIATIICFLCVLDDKKSRETLKEKTFQSISGKGNECYQKKSFFLSCAHLSLNIMTGAYNPYV